MSSPSRTLFPSTAIAGGLAGLMAGAVYLLAIFPIITHAQACESAGSSGNMLLHYVALLPILPLYLSFGFILGVSAELLSGLDSLDSGLVWGAGGFVLFDLAPAICLAPQQLSQSEA